MQMFRARLWPRPHFAFNSLYKRSMNAPTPFSWPRERRITRRAEYTACYNGGERRYTRYFVVFAYAPETSGHGRLGLAVTKKCGNAVARNRIKRVLRSFFRLNQQNMPPLDIVVTPKKHLQADKFDLTLAETELLPVLLELGNAERASNGGLA